MSLKIMVIPDTQCKPGVPLDHLSWAGQYAVDKRPDVIVHIGDHADMPSLSEYDKGKKCYEGKRYSKDVDAAKRGMDLLTTPIRAARSYSPRLVLTLGNHEHRIIRATEADAKLDGTIGLDDLAYADYGWKVHEFLKPVVIGGVYFSHYFPTGVKGLPATKPAKILSTYHVPAVAGHKQGRDIAYAQNGQGAEMIAIIAGSYYQHDENYLTPFANKCWRGIVMLHEVRNGRFDEMFVSLNFLKRRFA